MAVAEAIVASKREQGVGIVKSLPVLSEGRQSAESPDRDLAPRQRPQSRP